MTKIFSLLLAVLFVWYITSPILNPFDLNMFGSHDVTQVSRVTGFVQNLKTFHIPPRVGPEYSFNLGYPAFNFYAPTAYWITGIIALFVNQPIVAVKLSFLIGITTALLGMYYFLTQLFQSQRKHWAALVGASAYVTCTYMASEINVRGNLAETWFLALLPLGLGLVIHNSRTARKWSSIALTLVLALLFTSHNMMALFAMPIVFIFILFFPQLKKNYFSFFLAMLIDSYFFIPFIFETSLLQSTHIIKEYAYSNHFLCAWQLWTAKFWAFGDSVSGCDGDTMSFKIGKIQTIFGLLGLIALTVKVFLAKKITKPQLALFFVAVCSIGGSFLTLYWSQFIWDFFAPVMALFQFPWRFVVFGMFGVAVFAGYLFESLPIPQPALVAFGLMFILFLPGKKYFIKPMTSFADFEQRFNSTEYVHKHFAQGMPEYIVKGVDYDFWRSLEPQGDNPGADIGFDYTQPVEFHSAYQILQNQPFFQAVVVSADGELKINKHYFPFWVILVNQQQIIPQQFDKLARPILAVHAGDTVVVQYEQTRVEKIADILTVLGLLLLFVKTAWKKSTN